MFTKLILLSFGLISWVVIHNVNRDSTANFCYSLGGSFGLKFNINNYWRLWLSPYVFKNIHNILLFFEQFFKGLILDAKIQSTPDLVLSPEPQTVKPLSTEPLSTLSIFKENHLDDSSDDDLLMGDDLNQYIEKEPENTQKQELILEPHNNSSDDSNDGYNGDESNDSNDDDDNNQEQFTVEKRDGMIYIVPRVRK